MQENKINMNIEKLTVGFLIENCYVISSKDNHEAMVVDPGDEANKIIQFLKAKNLTLSKILLTHGHIDHIGACSQLYQAFQPEIFLHQNEYSLYQRVNDQAKLFGLPELDVPETVTFINEKDKIPFAGQFFEVIYTPGHTQGSICYHSVKEHILFTGDTLFKESIGRTDLPGSIPDIIIPSIKKKLLTLADKTVIYPGHMGKSTIGSEKQRNPFLMM